MARRTIRTQRVVVNRLGAEKEDKLPREMQRGAFQKQESIAE